MSEDPLTTDPNALNFTAPLPDETVFAAAHNVVDGTAAPEAQMPAQPETEANPNILSKAEWHQAAEEAFAEASETGKPLSIVFADISAFKAVNDTLGHDEGDRVIQDLQGVFKLVSHSFRTRHSSSQDTRPLDVVSEAAYPQTDAQLDVAENEEINTRPGRVGGDEFTILCETDEKGAQAIKERLEKVFYSYMELPSSQRLKELGVDIAVGTGTKQDTDTSVGEVLKRADDDMYEDKLDKLPALDAEQKQKVLEATRLLQEAGIRQRDVPKYLKRFERAAAAEPQLPFPEAPPTET